MMKKVLNVSKRVLYISTVTLKPGESYSWEESYMTLADINKIKSYENLNFVKVFTIEAPLVTQTEPIVAEVIKEPVVDVVVEDEKAEDKKAEKSKTTTKKVDK